MDKKQILMAILTQLVPYREMAQGLIALLDSSYIDDSTMDSLVDMMSKAIKTVKKSKDKLAIQKSIAMVQEIKHMEEDEKMSQEDLDKMLESI